MEIPYSFSLVFPSFSLLTWRKLNERFSHLHCRERKKEISKDSEKLTWREEKSAARKCGVHVEPTCGPTFADVLLLQPVSPNIIIIWQVAVMEMDKALNLFVQYQSENCL